MENFKDVSFPIWIKLSMILKKKSNNVYISEPEQIDKTAG